MSATAATVVAKRDNTFPAMLEQFKPEIARALPKHLSADRMCRIAMTEFRKNPALGKCDPKSVFASIIIASQLGLEPGIIGQGYLVPYKSECQFIPGWQGLVDLVARAGRASVWTGAVFQGDDFDYAQGDRPFINHKGAGEDDPNKLTHVYAVGRVKGAEWPIIEVWPIAKVEKHFDKYNKVGDKHYAFKHFEMYARKIVLLQVLKYIPKSVEVSQAIELDHSGMKNKQGFDIKDAVEGTWVAPDKDDGDDTGTDSSRSEALKDKLRGVGTNGYTARYTDDAAIKAIADAATIDAVIEVWKDISADYNTSGRTIPTPVEAKKHDRLAALGKL